ncbi:MAG: energy-coupling factor ABC transporter substrate-binding protein [Magnetococcales bacterium]|nr:energy-coupling factor ABC transporter substrate-binding protein [Magnetococcales bacterium]
MAMNRSIGLIAMAGAIIVAPLLLPGVGGGGFEGTDDRATEAIAAVSPGHRPWFRPLWEPPGDAVESLLFTLQAALGAGVIGYVLGRRRRLPPPGGDDVTDR